MLEYTNVPRVTTQEGNRTNVYHSATYSLSYERYGTQVVTTRRVRSSIVLKWITSINPMEGFAILGKHLGGVSDDQRMASDISPWGKGDSHWGYC